MCFFGPSNIFSPIFTPSVFCPRPSSSGGLCVAGWDGGFVAEEPFQGLPEVGTARTTLKRHHHCPLRSQDLTAGRCGKEQTSDAWTHKREEVYVKFF